MYNLLEGKAKSDFDKYLSELENEIKAGIYPNSAYSSPEQYFEQLTPSMQYGVIEDFFDSKEIFVDIDYCIFHTKTIYEVYVKQNKEMVYSITDIKTRHQARDIAVEKLVKTYNKS